MRVPIAEQKVKQQGIPGAQQHSTANSQTFQNPTALLAGMALSKGLQDVGGALLAMDQQKEQEYARQQQEANHVRSLDTFNQYQQFTQDQLYSETGALNRRGDAAFKPIEGRSPTDMYMEDRTKKRQQLLQGLSNSEQRLAFAEHADSLDLHVRGQLMGHEAEQHRVYQDSVYTAGIETSKTNAALNYNDPVASQKAFADIASHSVALAKLHGKSEDFGLAQAQQYQSDAIKSQIDASLQHGNDAMAMQLYRQHSERLDPNDRINIENKISDTFFAKKVNEDPQAVVSLLSGAAANSTIKGLSAQQAAKLAPFEADITEQAQAHGVSPEFMRAQIMAESSGNPGAVSRTATSTGQPSIGLTQFQPATAKRYGIDPTDPKQAIKGQAMYMADLLKMFNGDYSKAAAGYNWGEGHVQKAVTKHGDNWLQHAPAETRNYVAKLTGGSEQPTAATGTPADMMNSMDRVKWLNAAQNRLEHGQAVFRAGLENETTNQLAQIAGTGQTGNLKSLAEFQQAYGDKAPLYHADYMDQVDFNRQYFGIKDMPIDKAQALLTAAQPKASPDSQDFAREQKQYTALASALAHANEARQNDPIAYAYNAGFPVNPINWQNPGQAAAELKNRLAVTQRLSDTYRTPPLILTKEEQKQLGETFDQMPADDALKLMDSLKQGTSPAMLQMTMQQLKENSPVTALAGQLYGLKASYNDPNWYGGSTKIEATGQQAAKYMLIGDRLIKEKKSELYLPPETNLRAAFDLQTNGAFSGKPETANTTYQAVKATYAGLSAETGDTAKDFSQDTFNKAMELVTGSKDGALEVYNNKVIPPYGMPEDVFMDKVETEFYRQVRDNNLPVLPGMINSYKIIPLDDGVYGFTDGNTIKPIVVNLNANNNAIVDQINPTITNQ